MILLKYELSTSNLSMKCLKLIEPHEDQKVDTIHEYINNRQSFVAIGEVEITSETRWRFKKVLRISPEANGAGDSE